MAYLCAGAHQLETLRAITPPWIVGLPAQVAAVRALQAPDYYAKRYAETAALRIALAEQLSTLNWHVLPGIANFLLCQLPSNGPSAANIVDRCLRDGLFLRDAASMSPIPRSTYAPHRRQRRSNERAHDRHNAIASLLSQCRPSATRPEQGIFHALAKQFFRPFELD